MQLLILSDIHGNVSALNSVLSDVNKRFRPNALALLGDNIDYGMRSNEVIAVLKTVRIPMVCSLWGNHEYAILKQDYAHFSSERGVASAKRTRQILTAESMDYLNKISGKEGYAEFELNGKKFLAVHGNLENKFWGGLKPEGSLSGYEKYDYVLSGHTHYAHIFPRFYDSDDKAHRNKKRTIFINPGSVGQPRNHDPRAQYAVLDLEQGIFLCGTDYDIAYEQSLFTDDVDPFYRDRLTLGV
ncbi:MAG: metallophosphoesterase family protein [Huintestinicola sp.]|uniref:metallophosphoesterase family protein n=1 Tax=Huintestinicola sp. TaxID=2981661 RepID=UPI003F0A5A7A